MYGAIAIHKSHHPCAMHHCTLHLKSQVIIPSIRLLQTQICQWLVGAFLMLVRVMCLVLKLMHHLLRR